MFSNTSLFFGILFITLSTASGAALIALLIINKRNTSDNQWRDPPPLIFRIFAPVTQLFSHYVRIRMGQAYFEKIHKKISVAGMTYSILPEEFITLRFIFGAIASMFSIYIFKTFDSFEAQLVIVGLPVLGFFYPDIWIKDRTTARKFLVEKQFPFLMDLLTLSMKAGLNYSTSINQTIESLPDGPVKEEFSRYLRELKSGKNRREAIESLADRIDVPSVNNFAAALKQADETGGEISEVLKAQSAQRRAERFNEAERKANQAPVKMLLPLVLFLFPVLFMIIAFVMATKAVDAGIAPLWMANLLKVIV